MDDINCVISCHSPDTMGEGGGGREGFTCTPMHAIVRRCKNRLAARLPTASSSPEFDLQEASKGLFCAVLRILIRKFLVSRVQIHPITSKKGKKNLDFYYFWTSFLRFIYEKWHIQKVIRKKLWTLNFGILSATDEKSRTRIRKSVERIWIRIRTKMSRIHNTAPVNLIRIKVSPRNRHKTSRA